MTEREREALMRLTMCARNECVMCKYKDSCDSDVRFEFATKHMNILADALLNTESNSEKPNNCDEPQLTPNYCGTCKHREVPCGDLPCDVCHGYSNYEPKDEPTISKMEQVDEPQNGYQTFSGTSVYVSRFEEEPQYEMGMGTLKCDNCSEYGSFKCTKCDGEMYFKRLEPNSEPQTDCPWK